jgi:hypothetical protein
MGRLWPGLVVNDHFVWFRRMLHIQKLSQWLETRAPSGRSVRSSSIVVAHLVPLVSGKVSYSAETKSIKSTSSGQNSLWKKIITLLSGLRLRCFVGGSVPRRLATFHFSPRSQPLSVTYSSCSHTLLPRLLDCHCTVARTRVAFLLSPGISTATVSTPMLSAFRRFIFLPSSHQNSSLPCHLHHRFP